VLAELLVKLALAREFHHEEDPRLIVEEAEEADDVP
jgi:hypothetical protein